MKIIPYIIYPDGSTLYLATQGGQYAYGFSFSQAIANLLGILLLNQ